MCWSLHLFYFAIPKCTWINKLEWWVSAQHMLHWTFFEIDRRRIHRVLYCVYFIWVIWHAVCVCALRTLFCISVVVVIFISGLLQQQFVFVSTHAVVQRTYSYQHNDKRLTECNYIRCGLLMGWAMHYAYKSKTDETITNVENDTLSIFGINIPLHQLNAVFSSKRLIIDGNDFWYDKRETICVNCSQNNIISSQT